jgi:hypothetical protein
MKILWNTRVVHFTVFFLGKGGGGGGENPAYAVKPRPLHENNVHLHLSDTIAKKIDSATNTS